MPESSTELEPIVSEAPVAAADPTPAPVVSAEPTPADKPTSAIDAVTRALAPAPKDGVDAGAPTAENRSSKDGTGTQDKPPVAGEPAADPSEEEIKQYTPGAQKRIRELVAEKNTARGQVEAATRELDTFKPRAESYDKLTGYLTRNGITSDEANNSLEVTRLIKAGDFANALKVLTPIYQEVQKRAGEVLPPDLQEEVRLGHTPHERALELSRLRANETAAAERQAQEGQRQRTEAQQTAWNTHVQTVAKAADDWAKGKAAGDPDWDKKATEVADIVDLAIRRDGFPKSKEAALQISEQALAKVNTRWKSLRGPLGEIKPMVGTGRASPREGAPKTAMEAVNRALGG